MRRVRARLLNLPPDSAVAAAVSGTPREWPVTAELLAQTVDQLRVANFLTAKAHFKGRPEKPEPLKRPWVTDSHAHERSPQQDHRPARRMDTPEQLLRFVTKHSGGAGG